VASPYPETRWTVWAKSLGALLVGVASVLVSWTAVAVQRSVANNQKANSLEDLALKHKTFDQQKELDEARLAASLIPFLKCNDDLQRASALQLLSKSAPTHAVILGGLLLQKCPDS
jgi:ABC-type thiamine transport system substrate-binding protein